MSEQWQLREARNRFSRVIDRARDTGPQTIMREDEPVAVVLSIDDYRRLVRRGGNLLEFLRSSPLCGVELDIERPRG